MNCLLCRQAEIANGFTSVTLERGEIQLVVNNVPARICSNCGEAYVDANVAVHLLWEADLSSMAGTQSETRDYDSGE